MVLFDFLYSFSVQSELIRITFHLVLSLHTLPCINSECAGMMMHWADHLMSYNLGFRPPIPLIVSMPTVDRDHVALFLDCSYFQFLFFH